MRRYEATSEDRRDGLVNFVDSIRYFIVLLSSFFLAGCLATPSTSVKPDPNPKPQFTGSRFYELTISPTWGNKVSFRVQNSNDGGTLQFKRYAGRSGYTDGASPETRVLHLSAAEFGEFEDLVSRSGYERMGQRDPDIGLDGDSWSLTVRRAGFEHTAVRWCPNAYNPKRRGTVVYVEAFRWCADKAGVTATITNKGPSLFDRS